MAEPLFRFSEKPPEVYPANTFNDGQGDIVTHRVPQRVGEDALAAACRFGAPKRAAYLVVGDSIVKAGEGRYWKDKNDVFVSYAAGAGETRYPFPPAVRHPLGFASAMEAGAAAGLDFQGGFVMYGPAEPIARRRFEGALSALLVARTS